jgi:branched-chain amino acid transport system ATP-binding protein
MSFLQLINVTKNFGGLRAVGSLDLEVKRGEILGLIGPNGAGKTTVFNLITGFFRPDQGDIRFDDTSLIGLKPHDVSRLGVTRTFQLVKPFAGLTVLENVMVGAFHMTKDRGIAKKEALRILDFLELSHLRRMKAGALTISDRKHLEIARALATQPKILLLDEPMAGMNPTEVDLMMGQIQRIREEGTAIFIIEHVMKAIMAISYRIVVLHHGEKIAEGTPKEVSTNQDVITAYLGEESLVSSGQ